MAGKTNRKHRRNKEWCELYEKKGTREFNKELKLARHRAKHPEDSGQKGPVNYKRKKPLDYFERAFLHGENKFHKKLDK